MTVGGYLDCGILERGFARVRCPTCRAEYLVAFSCKGRGLCPSRAAKRAAALAAFLREEVLADVGHAQWVFSLPKMLRPYLLYHRELLGALCRLAYDTVLALMVDAAGQGSLKQGMGAVVQTFGDTLSWNPHVHALVTRGGWDGEGLWWPLPFVDQLAAAAVFRHKVLRLLARKGLLDEERIELLLSWRHSGFSVHNTVTVSPGDGDGLERLARYLLRAPVSLERLSLDEAAGTARYRPRAGRGDRQPAQQAPSDPAELLARVLMHIPQPRLHMVRYYGAYSSVVRARRRSVPLEHGSGAQRQHASGEHDAVPSDPERRALRRSWAALIRRIYEVDPLVCPRCGSPMRTLVFITEAPVIRRILEHIARKHPEQNPRSPPAE